MIDFTNPEPASLFIEQAPFTVVAMNSLEGLSRLFTFELICEDPSPSPRVRELIGQNAAIELRDALGHARRVHGVITSAVRTLTADRSRLRVRVEPRAHRLTLRRNCRAFHDLSVVGVALELLREHGVAAVDRTTERYMAREYCAQYREDDWTFLSRLLEDEGIYFAFVEEGDDTVLILSDRSSSAPPLREEPLPFAYDTGLIARREQVREFAREVDMTAEKFTVGSFDPRRPALAVRGSSGEGVLEVYDARGAGPRSPEACERAARILRERAAVDRVGCAGLTTSIRFAPGLCFELEGHPLGLDGRYLVTEVEHRVSQRRSGAAEASSEHEVRFRAIPAETLFRPARATPQAKQPGLQTGVVVGPKGQELHMNAEGRVRVQHHWDREGARDERAGTFVRVAQRGVAASLLLPRVGWTVLTSNEEGAVDAPELLSRLHDGDHLPVYRLPDHKTRVVFRTATTPADGSSNEIHFEDRKGGEEVRVVASRDMNVLVQRLRHEMIDNDASRTVGGDREVAVARELAEHVHRDQRVAIGGDESAVIDGGQIRNVAKGETTTIAGSATLKTGGGHSTTVTGTRSLAVGAALIDASLGHIGAQSSSVFTLMAGGGIARAASATVAEDVGKVAVQAVGGAKLEFAREDQLLKVDRLIERVGGFMTVRAGRDLVEQADESLSLEAGSSLSLAGADLVIKADKRIELRSGATLIALTPEKIEISAATIELGGPARLDVKAPLIRHN